MEELFRFSVIRPASRSNPATVSLNQPVAPPPPPPPAPPQPTVAPVRSTLVFRPAISPTLPSILASSVAPGVVSAPSAPPPPKSFQDELRDLVQSLLPDHPSPQRIWKRLEPIALDYILKNWQPILTNTLWSNLEDFLTGLRSFDPSTFPLPSQWPAQKWTGSAIEIVRTGSTQGAFDDYKADLADLFIALLITRRGGPANLDPIVRSAQLWDLAELLSDKPSLQDIADHINVIVFLSKAYTLNIPAGTKPADASALVYQTFQVAMSQTLLLPRGIFAPFEKPIHGIGFREFHVVKQHIRRYESAEIGRIENVLKGESRDHATKHTLSNESDTFLQTDTTTETDKELTSTDHIDIKNEAQNQVKEDTKVDAGVHAQYSSGDSFKLNADLTVSYDKATDDTNKYASDVAKDVTQKAVSKVSQRITQSQTTKIIETWEESEDQSYDNKTGTGHISGVYQWVEKVYLCQTFNLGRHMLFDIMVPEPAANLLALATVPADDQSIPVPPYPLGTILKDSAGNPKLDKNGNLQLDTPLNPLDLTDDPTDVNFYGIWVARYGATSVDSPPTNTITVAKPLTISYKDDDTKQTGDTLRIDDGYGAYAVSISIDAMRNDGVDANTVWVDLSIGSQTLHMPWPNNPRNALLTAAQLLVPGGQTGSISFTIWGPNIDQMNANLEVQCKALPALTAKWKLQTYEKIRSAWQALQTAYETKMAAAKMQQANVGPLGAADSEANRLTERIELKRASIAIIDNDNNTVRGLATPPAPPNTAVTPFPPGPPALPPDSQNPQLPEPVLPPPNPNPNNLATTQELGARVRWFEQAFEWENMAYVFYPYYWGRRSQWIQGMNLKNTDQLFLNFLQAGYARVVVPVRLGFEWAVHFYLHTGLPWLGGGLPAIGDDSQNPLYLDIAEEIKAITGGGEKGEREIPIDDPWEYTIPTTLMKLRKDDATPEWHRVGLDGKEDEKNYPSDQPGGPWLWRDGPPKT